MTSRREHPTHSTGAPPAHPVPRQTYRARDDPYLDGLFTYCLSVMCEHESAIAAVGEGLALADRQRERGRAPEDPQMLRPWLYALVRWACLRRLAQHRSREEERKDRAETSPSGGAQDDRPRPGASPYPEAVAELSEGARKQRHRELSALAWPEAAGTAPEQREALELSVRHGLPTHEVAAVLSLAPEAATALLSTAACEVERTRAALTVVESGGCAAVSRLAGDDRLLMGTTLRRELVRHVDECPECRRAAERAMAGVSWPGTAPTSGTLAVLEAPRAAVRAALAAAKNARAQRVPRFDRAGFPVEIKDRSARRRRFRSRAVTSTVVATVLAAPVLALWAAYRDAPVTGERESDRAVASSDESDMDGFPYENAGRRGSPEPDGKAGDGEGSGLRVETRGGGGGGLSAVAEPLGRGTLITLTATGGKAVRWTVNTHASWLLLSRTHGVLEPGESAAVKVAVDREREPGRAWAAHIRVAPAGAVVTLRGDGRGSGSAPATPSRPGTHPTHGPGPSKPQPSSPRPSDGPSDPSPSDPSPPESSEPPSSPPPTPSPTSGTPTPSTLPAR